MGTHDVKNWSNPEEVREAFMKKFTGDQVPHVKNWSNPDELRDDFVKRFAGSFVPQAKNKSDLHDWKEASINKYDGSLKKNVPKSDSAVDMLATSNASASANAEVDEDSIVLSEADESHTALSAWPFFRAALS